MDTNFLKEEDLADLLGEITFKAGDIDNMSEEIKASERRVDEYLKKNLDNE